ncbi:hypothetical protein PoB_005743000 [Plakobranchus ocellatus]|uniref:Uncharacterized protein n=1 Tax=Plakobranchus ocellatus TaxID=259542 RepID=A0AAV4CDT1_9GAST|nr:hypothetical protein PoB_005743000 [Plakobranchus ocellatus]
MTNAGFVYSQGDLRLSGPPLEQGAGGGAQTRDGRLHADFWADSLSSQGACGGRGSNPRQKLAADLKALFPLCHRRPDRWALLTTMGLLTSIG